MRLPGSNKLCLLSYVTPERGTNEHRPLYITSHEVSLECLSGGLGSISDLRCITRWCCALTFFLNLVPGSRPMHCCKIYLSPAIDSPGQQSCLCFDNKVKYSHPCVSKHGCRPYRWLSYSPYSAGWPYRAHPQATLGGRGGLLKTIHHMNPLQNPLFQSKGQEKAKFYSKSQSWEKPIGKAWREFYSLSRFHSLMLASLVCFQISEGR